MALQAHSTNNQSIAQHSTCAIQTHKKATSSKCKRTKQMQTRRHMQTIKHNALTQGTLCQGTYKLYKDKATCKVVSQKNKQPAPCCSSRKRSAGCAGLVTQKIGERRTERERGTRTRAELSQKLQTNNLAQWCTCGQKPALAGQREHSHSQSNQTPEGHA